MRAPYITRQRYRMLVVMVRESRPMTATEIADKAQLSPRTVRTSLNKLTERGWLDAASEGAEQDQAPRYSVVPHLHGHIRAIATGVND